MAFHSQLKEQFHVIVCYAVIGAQRCNLLIRSGRSHWPIYMRPSNAISNNVLHHTMIVFLVIISIYLSIVVYCTSSGSQSFNQPLHDHGGLNLELSLAPPISSSKYTTQSVHNIHGTNDVQNVQDDSSRPQSIGQKRKRYKHESVNPEIFQPGFRARTSEEKKERRKFQERKRYKEKIERLQKEGKEAIEEFRQVQGARQKASVKRLYDDPIKLENYRKRQRINSKRWYDELKQNDPIAYKNRREKANLSNKISYHARKDKQTKE